MKIAAIIEARMTSTRLPGKVLRPVLNRPLLDYMIDRVSQMLTLDEIIIATTTNKFDDPIVQLANKRNIKSFRGSEEDVLERVLLAAKKNRVDIIVEMTADCPLIDPIIADTVVRKYLHSTFDFYSNCVPISFPRGMDTKVFSTETLEEVAKATNHPTDREHVSYYIYNHPEKYSVGYYEAPGDLKSPDTRLTVDTEADFKLIENIFENLWPLNNNFLLFDILNYLEENKELRKINHHIKQKEVGY